MIKMPSFIRLAGKKYRHAIDRWNLVRELGGVHAVNFHRRNPRNLGDMKCAPAEYVEGLEPFVQIEIFRCRFRMALSSKPVIVGGGGLLSNAAFSRHLANIVASEPRFLVCWGAGQNAHGSELPTFPELLRSFDLVGVRDDKSPYEWVPCASCLADAFDERYQVQHEVVLYNHREFSSLRSVGFPQLSNAETDFRRAVQFLASGATVLTTSYHGAYWATLLGRRVVVLNPFSSKFFAFRHPPVLAPDTDWPAAIKRAVAFPGALAECREANYAFASKVLDLLAGKG